jgi:chemotaxis protein methyltransferase CheR
MSEEINATDFKFLVQLSEEWMGSVFKEDKKYLFENRLLSMVRRFGYSSISELIQDLRSNTKNFPTDKKNFFIDLITTHETLFFRDKTPFLCMKDVIQPDFLKQQLKNIHFYSAACSTGQEPVSLAMQMSEWCMLNPGIEFSIFATDISEACLQYAQDGSYTQYEMQRGIPIKLLNKYFSQHDTNWVFKPEYKKLIQYKLENLLTPIPKLFKFDLVFCRNVTIYMDKDKVRKVYEKIHETMKKGAWLVIGHSERMTDHPDLFEFVKTEAGIIYRRT